MIDVIFDHPDFVVINKPIGVSVHKDDQAISFIQRLQQQLNEPQLYLVHRLDKITSGLLILAKNTDANRQLSSAFQQRKVDKFYIALTDKRPRKKQGLITGDMIRSRRGTWKLVRTNNNPAISQFFSYGCGGGLRLFLIKPYTGKTHQIRVALKSLGSPIIGDHLYYPNPDKNIDRSYLHAFALQFRYHDKLIQLHCMPTTGHLFSLDTIQQQLVQLTKPWILKWSKIKQNNKEAPS
ncbi:TIGR01621 family pseudouridine synthase [Endozoicomonas sp. SM1973]|uniref:TIGR01621 family pseudouridine synthase n=1 Tax=Spartinivicinus marinus TaxID=2994442 RepID=A0A853IGR7_9GAMM|nr:TIGR01621 family pseudouridine synthase [Spartinivicinus marinus]MCX4025389.1 TIGR01621 family pseudouridine synthase [Spartinivicinus marinus]NYZ69201.1 TIGR01621 family pseudouridine synthase [Spartinivicinus marinus]